MNPEVLEAFDVINCLVRLAIFITIFKKDLGSYFHS